MRIILLYCRKSPRAGSGTSKPKTLTAPPSPFALAVVIAIEKSRPTLYSDSLADRSSMCQRTSDAPSGDSTTDSQTTAANAPGLSCLGRLDPDSSIEAH